MSDARVPGKPRHAVLPKGTVVGARYRVEAVIGEGSQSVVYLAHREPGDEAVALKVIHRHLCGDPQLSRRFEREASILRRLDGEHVVRLLDFVEDGGLLAIALERVAGVSLEALLAERAPLDLGVAIEITLQVCAALGAAHANGIVHRDLKTANVLVERPESSGLRPALRSAEPSSAPSSGIRVKVVDFGLSKVLQGDSGVVLTEQGMIFGTPAYMAPEQARGDEVDARSDLYAVGVMLYEMAVGAPPFSGRSALGTMSAHLREAPPSPRAACPGSSITPAMEAVILRALSKSPADRFASAREFAQAIAAARDQPRVIAPSGIENPDELATRDTDLHVLSPSFGQAKTLRPDELAAARDGEGSGVPPARINVPSQAPPSTLPSPGQPAASAKIKVAHPETLDELTVLSGALPRRASLMWTVVAILAAVVGVVIGVLVGTR
jgi:serine/threonine protein kinase